MTAVLERPAASPYSVKKMVKPVNFYYEKPDAGSVTPKSVTLMGDFNDWDPNSLPMQRRADGWWFIQVPLTHGHHAYVFLVDGAPTLDPKAIGAVQLNRNTKASVIAVS